MQYDTNYDRGIAIEYTRRIDKHNGYTDFMNFVLQIIETGKMPRIEHPSMHAAKYVLDYFNKKGIRPDKSSKHLEIISHINGVIAAAEAFPHDSDFEKIADVSEDVLAEGLKPGNEKFMKKVREKKREEQII